MNIDKHIEAELMETDELTEEEMEILLESYKMMQKLAMEGKMIYSFDQEWLM